MKDEADARQVQLQKEMKEEVERLKTQFIFKVFSTPFFVNATLTSS
jgi:hypothetical protein